MYDDLEIMSDLPDVTITLNLLTGDSSHSIAGQLDLHIAKEIQAWLEQQSEKEDVDVSQLKSATLEVDVSIDKVTTKKKKVVTFIFECRSNLKTDEASYQATVKETHQWHTRVTN